MELGVHPLALSVPQSRLRVFDQRAGRLRGGTAGQGPGAVGDVEVRKGASLGRGRAAGTGFRGEGVGKVSGEPRHRSQRQAAAGQLAPWQGGPGHRKKVPRPGWESRPPAKPPRSPSPERQLPSPYSPRSLGSVCLRSRSFAQVPPPQPGLAARCAPASPLPRAPRPHLRAGAGPAHRPEQQQRQAERPGGAGHGGALRTEPSLPPAEPRATTNPGRAASGGRGGGAGAGPPRPREGPGGVPGLQPRPAKASRSSPWRCSACPCRLLPGPAPPTPALPPRCLQLRKAKPPHTYSGYAQGNLSWRSPWDWSKVTPSLRPFPESVTLRTVSD